MIERLNPRSRSDAYGRRINRDHSVIRATVVPWLSILFFIFLQTLPIATALPILPPLGLIMLIGWRLIRPGLLPVWAGFPLGFADDLFSGQPFGCAILLWSLSMIAIDIFDARVPWRSFVLDWAVASAIVTLYLLTAMVFSGAPIELTTLTAMVPQLLFSLLSFPLIARLISWLDRVRLQRVRVVN